MTINSFADVHKVLEQYIPPARSMRGAYTLTTIKQLMNALGNPQNQYRTVHVAGTSGKTSTAYYAAALLKESGYKVGLTISPHIDEVNERVQINVQPLNERQYCDYFTAFMQLTDESGITPTYFELLVAFAFWVFAKEKVDYAVVEVGLGGLLDATNVINRADKVCIITDIGLDHTTVLGRTVSAIAAQKAGIIQQFNTVVMYQQDDKVMKVVEEVCDQEHATLHEIKPLSQKNLPENLPLYQQRNWYLAWFGTELIRTQEGKHDLTARQIKRSTGIIVPARMQKLQLRDKTIVLDGAHNIQKITALVQALKKDYPDQKIAIVIGFINGKGAQVRSCLRLLKPIASHFIITSFQNIQDQRKTSVKPAKIAEALHMIGSDSWEIEPDAALAYDALMHRPEAVVLVTGSFYLINELRPIILAQATRTQRT